MPTLPPAPLDPADAPASPADLRREYARGGLLEADVSADPVAQFDRWFRDALAADVVDANAMSLATVDADGRPACRVVLLKEFDARGFVFHTNGHSRKGRELAANPRAALCFFWPALERQVRIEGEVSAVSDAEADAYFASRPRAARIGAHVSAQSEVVATRAEIDGRYAELEAAFGDGEVARPPHWGGYRLSARAVEFWQGRASRLHDRLRYRLVGSTWVLERLWP